MRRTFYIAALLITFLSISFSTRAQEEKQKAHYRGIVQLGYMAAAGNNGVDRVPLDVINGCQFNKFLYMGIGVGIRYYHPLMYKTYVLPVYLNTRLNFSKKPNAAFFSLNLGYSLNASYKLDKIGFLISPMLGVNIPGNDHISFSFGAGLEIQTFKTWDNYYYSPEIVMKMNNALCAFVGINF
jgi:hypothetical protein